MACFIFPSRGVEIISIYFSIWLWTVAQFNTPRNKMSLKELLVIVNGFLIYRWKYIFWISKNENFLRTTVWKGCWLLFYPNCVWACHFVSEKCRQVYWINAREWPNYTLSSQQFWKLTNSGLKWCSSKIYVKSCLSVIKHQLWRTSKEPFSSLLWLVVLCNSIFFGDLAAKA